MYYFTSDTHFGHDRCMEHDKRPFATIEEHDKELIKRWNSVVGYNDTVFHLGDFSYRNKQPIEWYVEQLKGQIIFIRGNHDDKLMWRYNDPAKVTKYEALYLRHEEERMY